MHQPKIFNVLSIKCNVFRKYYLDPNVCESSQKWFIFVAFWLFVGKQTWLWLQFVFKLTFVCCWYANLSNFEISRCSNTHFKNCATFIERNLESNEIRLSIQISKFKLLTSFERDLNSRYLNSKVAGLCLPAIADICVSSVCNCLYSVQHLLVNDALYCIRSWEPL